jgi:hypothetical protein
MPGRVATFATCSRDLSMAGSGISAGEVNTMPGTRIGPVGSIRNRNGLS